MYGIYENIRIAGVQAAVPARIVDTKEVMEQYNLGNAKTFVNRTGISQRRIVSEGQSATDMSTVAASELMTNLRWKPEEIKVIVNVSRSVELVTPSMAMIIQKRLGIGTDCVAFDVNLGCTAFVSGLQIISALLSNIGGKGLLLVGYGIDGNATPQNRNDLLFGHASAATAIETMEGGRILYSQNTDGTRFQHIYTPVNGESVMDGNAVLMFALTDVSDSIREFKSYFSLEEDDIDYYVLHQAQKIILDGIADECRLPEDKVLTSYKLFGNTNTTSIPVTMCLHSEILRRKESVRLHMCGFGVGLAWSNVYLEMDSDKIFPILETDKTYDDCRFM